MNRDQALKILNLSGNPSDEDIKKAFKKLAKKYHPDLNKDADSIDKFKEINTAQEVLLNKQESGAKFQYKTYNRQGTTSDFNFDDFFNNFFTSDSKAFTLKPHPADLPIPFKDLIISIPVSLNQFIFADVLVFNVSVKKACPTCLTDKKYFARCGQCGGMGETSVKVNTPYGNISRNRSCLHCKGKGWVRSTLCKTCKGSFLTDYPRKIQWNLANKKIEFNKKILFKGNGHIGHKCKPSNLYIIPMLLKPDLSALSTSELDSLKEILKKI